jgi:thioredoxin
MLIKIQRLLPSVAIIAVLMFLGGCEKWRTVAGKSDSAGMSKTEAAGVLRSNQISDLRQPDYANFIARKNALVIIDFHAEWCPPCKLLGPVLEKAVAAHPGVVYLGKVDVDESPTLAAMQNVTGLPDVRFFKDGRELGRFTGFPGEREVLDLIAKLAQGITPVEPAAQTPAEPTMQPFEKGWMPQGMKRQGEGAP